MKQPITPTEPQFIDEQISVIDAPPTFVTRTTLRSILQGKGVNTLSELEARSVSSSHSPLISSEISRTE